MPDEDVLAFAKKIASAIPADRRPDDVTFDDAIQDACLLVLKHRDQYTHDLSTRIAYAPWLYRRVLFDIKKQYERAGAHVENVRTALARVEPWHHALGARPMKEENVDSVLDVREAVERLPPNQRDVVKAVWFEGRTQSEVAAARGTGQPAVSQILQRAKRRLRALLGDDFTVD